jgi:uncharacterized protein (TIGR02284 family)
VDNAKVISTLNNLIETCKDAEQGFRTAAEGLRDTDARTLFQQYSWDRAQMAAELQAEVRKLGGDPDTSGTISGAMHRGWMNIKSVIAGNEDASIIAEAERGEDLAKKAYEQAAQEPLPPAVLALVQQQAARVRAVHDAVKGLRLAIADR